MADLANESLEDLQLKLSDYQANLQAIENHLIATPEDEELTRLKSDLEEVITFFTDLVNLRKAEKGAADLSEAALDRHKKEEEKNVVEPSPTALSLLKRTCVKTETVKFGEIVQLGVIDPQSRLPRTVKVRWLSNGRIEEISVGNVRLLTPMTSDSVHVGMQAQALYSGDGEWYPCRVDAIEADGYRVTYTEYRESELVAKDRLRPPDISMKQTSSGRDAEESKKVKEVVTPAGYRIPANLIVKPSDSEAQRLGKRRRLNALKRDQRMAAAEEEARGRQSTWLMHTKKASTTTSARLQTALLRGKTK